MAARRTQRGAVVGVVEHGNSAVLVTIAPTGELLDRRRIDLTKDLPTHPHHHEGSWAVGRYPNTPGRRAITLAEAVTLVERVHAAALRSAKKALAALSASVTVPIATITLRAYPELPPTIEERIRDNRAQTYADTAMYRDALASSAKARGWSVHWYEREGLRDQTKAVTAMGRVAGPPWQAQHKLAAAAALGVLASHRRFS